MRRNLELGSVKVREMIKEQNPDGFHCTGIAVIMEFVGADGDRQVIECRDLSGSRVNDGPFCFSYPSVAALKASVYGTDIHPKGVSFFWFQVANAITDLIPSDTVLAAA